MSRKLFSSKVGLVAATLGSAVGLGNVWRFPAEAQANGGAAFLLLYVGCVLVLGVPVMLAEMSLGRASRSDAIGAFKILDPKSKWWVIGVIAVTATVLISGFYMVVEGWTLEYLWHSVTGDLYDNPSGAPSQTFFLGKMDEYISSDIRPLVFTVIALAANMVVLVGGVQKGIERMSNVLMPMLFIVLAVLCCMTLSLDGAGAGLVWFLKPDFSAITWGTVINAMGQAFFSLSLGMGILVTYASYYPDKTNLSSTAITVALMSLLVAVMTGCVIFPSVSHFGLADHSLRGATLVFQTLPEVFSNLPLTQLWSILFFLLLFVAALTSTISLIEVALTFLQDRFGMKRLPALAVTSLPLLAINALCSLSFGSLSDWKILGLTFFDFLDKTTTNLFLPVTSIGICIFMGWVISRNVLRRQIASGNGRGWWAATVLFIIRFAAPLFISTILVANLL